MVFGGTLSERNDAANGGKVAEMTERCILLEQSDKLHTTELGAVRIRKNLKITVDDVVSWCRKKIQDRKCRIYRKGKNWYCEIDGVRITVNASCYTIITAHFA